MSSISEWRDFRDTFDLLELFQQIKKSFWILLLIMIVFGGAGYISSRYLMEPEYESAITMIVNTRQDKTGVVTNDNITSAQNLVSTYSIIIKSNTVLNQVIDDLNLDFSYEELEGKVYVNAVDDTQIMRIAVRNSSQKEATEIVKRVAEIAPEVIVDTVEAGSCKVISQVMESGSPVTPNIAKSTLLAMAAGVILGLAFIMFLTLFKEKRFIDDSDIQKYFDIPLLGVIPEVGGEYR